MGQIRKEKLPRKPREVSKRRTHRILRDRWELYKEVKIQCGERVPEMVQGVSHSCGYQSRPEDIRRVQIRGVT